MENDLLFSPAQHAMIGHFFAAALGAHVLGAVYFLFAKDRIAPRYRVATVLSLGVMLASGLLFYRLGQSWDLAFVQDGDVMVRTGNRFDGGARYINWLVTVPVLLVQVLFAFDLYRENVLRLRALLVVSGASMVLLGWVGQFREGTDDTWQLTWGALSTVPFVVLLVVLWQRLDAARAYLPAEAGRTAGNLRFVVLFFWGLYPIAYLIPVVAVSAEAAVATQLLYTVADVGSKVLYGILLAKVLRLRSAADGFGPALEPAQGALGRRPEDDPYRDTTTTEAGR